MSTLLPFYRLTEGLAQAFNAYADCAAHVLLLTPFGANDGKRVHFSVYAYLCMYPHIFRLAAFGLLKHTSALPLTQVPPSQGLLFWKLLNAHGAFETFFCTELSTLLSFFWSLGSLCYIEVCTRADLLIKALTGYVVPTAAPQMLAQRVPYATERNIKILLMC